MKKFILGLSVLVLVFSVFLNVSHAEQTPTQICSGYCAGRSDYGGCFKWCMTQFIINPNVGGGNTGLNATALLNAIANLGSFTKNLSVGSSGVEVKKVQTFLIKNGFLSGKADGKYGKNTVNAINKLQKKLGLPITGKLDAKTRSQVNLLPSGVPLNNGVGPNKVGVGTYKAPGLLKKNLGVNTPMTSCNSGDTPSITVLSPSGGDMYTAGQQVTIKWTSCNVQNVYLGMAQGGHDMGNITQNIPASQGLYQWTVPSAHWESNIGFFIGVWDADSAHLDVLGKSGSFTINPPSTTNITLVQPVDQAVWTAGNTYTITWTSGSGNVSLSVCNIGYTNTGLDPQQCSVIATNQSSSGSYAYTLPSNIPYSGENSSPSLEIRATDSSGYRDSHIIKTILAPTPQTGCTQPIITAALDSSSASAQILMPGTSGVSIASYKISTGNCSVTLTALHADPWQPTTNHLNPINAVMKFYDGSTLISSSSSSYFPGLNISIPANSSKVLTLAFDIGSQSVAGDTFKGRLNEVWFTDQNGNSSNIQAVLPNGLVLGNIMTIGNGNGTACVLTPSFVTSSSTASQYVASANGATDATHATYRFQCTGGSVTIQELKFSVADTNTVVSIKVNGDIAAVVGGVADITGLNIVVPNGSTGVSVDAYVSYPQVGISGIPSGSNSKITLTYVGYTDNNGVTGVITPSLSAPTMILVGSKPVVTVSQPPGVVMNTGSSVEAIDVTVKADNQGDIAINSIPLSLNMMGATVLPGVANNLIIKDQNNNPISGVVNTAFGSSTAVASIIYFNIPYIISAGQQMTFKIYVPINSITGTGSLPNAFMSSTINSPINFSWKDVAGNGGSFDSQNAPYLYNYPSTFTSSVHN